jgi:hypothetical protein
MKLILLFLAIVMLSFTACKTQKDKEPAKKSDMAQDVKVLNSTQEFKDEVNAHIKKGMKRIEDRTK